MRRALAWLITGAGMATLVDGVYRLAGLGSALLAAGVLLILVGLFAVDVDRKPRADADPVAGQPLDPPSLMTGRRNGQSVA